jgi:hypothetical protein
MIANFFMSASPVPAFLRALRRRLSHESRSFNGRIEANYESATRLGVSSGFSYLATVQHKSRAAFRKALETDRNSII